GALRAASLPQRAARLADALRLLWPEASLYACLLGDGSSSHAAVLDQAGGPHAEWSEVFRGVSSRPAPAELEGLIEALRARGITLVAEEVGVGESHQGLLALGISADVPDDLATCARALLAVCAGQAALALELEAQRAERQALQDQVAGLRWLAAVGELAGPMAHEFNNFLNVLLLHLAVLEHELPENLRSELAQIRKQGKEAAALIGRWQQYRRRPQPESRPVDLNRVVREVVRSLAEETSLSYAGLRPLIIAPSPPPLSPASGERGEGLAPLSPAKEERGEELALLSPAKEERGEELALLSPAKEERGEELAPLSPPGGRGVRGEGAADSGVPAGVVVRLELAADLPPVLGGTGDLDRLCAFLVGNAAAVTPDGGEVLVRTARAADQVLLRIEDSGPDVAPGLLGQVFEVSAAGRVGANGLELAACRSIVRRLQGGIRAESRAGGGVAVIVELPAALG
ncbi:MAG TPA: sensor histidine kinase, partial [Gemmataceae bacterium]|nr:sensor histidine kinase [Gemmataceae bacterium]